MSNSQATDGAFKSFSTAKSDSNGASSSQFQSFVTANSGTEDSLPSFHTVTGGENSSAYDADTSDSTLLDHNSSDVVIRDKPTSTPAIKVKRRSGDDLLILDCPPSPDGDVAATAVAQQQRADVTARSRPDVDNTIGDAPVAAVEPRYRLGSPGKHVVQKRTDGALCDAGSNGDTLDAESTAEPQVAEKNKETGFVSTSTSQTRVAGDHESPPAVFARRQSSDIEVLQENAFQSKLNSEQPLPTSDVVSSSSDACAPLPSAAVQSATPPTHSTSIYDSPVTASNSGDASKASSLSTGKIGVSLWARVSCRIRVHCVMFCAFAETISRDMHEHPSLTNSYQTPKWRFVRRPCVA